MVSFTAAPRHSHYHMVRQIGIGGDGGWDYLTMDSPSRRLFVSHADHVAVVNVDTGKVVGEIPKTEGVHGIAIASGLNRGFVSNGRTSTVTIFELDSLKVIGESVADVASVEGAERPTLCRRTIVSGAARPSMPNHVCDGGLTATAKLFRRLRRLWLHEWSKRVSQTTAGLRQS
jgi:hypothetical protein